MKKEPRPRNNREFRRLRGLTQEQVARLTNTKKSNVANAELAKTPFSKSSGASYSMFYGLTDKEMMGVAPNYALNLLNEPDTPYADSPFPSSAQPIYPNTSYVSYADLNPFRAEIKKLSNAFKGRRFFVPKRTKLRLSPNFSATELIDQSVFAFRRLACLSEKQAEPLSLHQCLKRKFDTDFLIWRASADYPALGIFRGYPVLIRPQTYYPQDRLVLCSDGVDHYFIGKILKPNTTLVNIQDTANRPMSFASGTFEIIGRLIMAYTMF